MCEKRQKSGYRRNAIISKPKKIYFFKVLHDKFIKSNNLVLTFQNYIFRSDREITHQRALLTVE